MCAVATLCSLYAMCVPLADPLDSPEEVFQPPVVELDQKEIRRFREANETLELPAIEVDLIEHSSVQGDKHFDQLLFWARYPNGELHIRDWRLVRNEGMLPKKHAGTWTASWEDKGVVYTVHSRSFRKTNSMIDPELTDRKSIPKANRACLWVSKQPVTDRAKTH